VKQSQHHRKGISIVEKELQKFSSKQEVWTQKKRKKKFWILEQQLVEQLVLLVWNYYIFI
jgi:hypothetical protein